MDIEVVVKYLEKNKSEYEDEKEQLLQRIEEYKKIQKENLNRIKLFKNCENEGFEAEINFKNESDISKVSELTDYQKKIAEELQRVCARVSVLDMKIDEVNSILKVICEKDRNIQKNRNVFNSEFNFVLLESIEAERQRIARDLHDTTVQNLTALVHKTELCLKLMDIDEIRCKLELTSMGEILRNVINDAREMIYDLRPMSFDDIGFETTIERFLDKLKIENNIRYHLQVKGKREELPDIVSIMLFRVIQEACNNAVKHGKASSVDVVFEYLQEQIILVVKDDGKGFDLSNLPKSARKDNSGFGLSMMRERVYLLNGKFEINSHIGEGCMIEVSLPLV